MTKEQFMESVLKGLEQRFPTDIYTVHSDIFIKNNDTKRCGVIIRRQDGIVAPTIYMEHFYDDYLQKKMTISEICDQIHLLYDKYETQCQKYESLSIDFEVCQSKIIYRLISMEYNEDFLKNIPHIPFLDLAITFHILLDCSEQGIESICVTNQIQERWQITTEDLYELAKENTPRLLPLTIETIEEALCECLGVDLFDKDTGAEPLLYVFGNKFRINGATALIYPDVIQNFAEKQDKNLYVIPSSIHEILVVPAEEEHSLSELSQMVKETNEKHVSSDEILANQAYFYDRNLQKFVV